MSSETYYSPKLSAERAAAIIEECNSIIAKTMSKMELYDVIDEEIAPAVAKEVFSQGVWEDQTTASFNQEVGHVADVTYMKSNIRGSVMDDSELLKGRMGAIKENLSKCVPRTIGESNKKTFYMSVLYDEQKNCDDMMQEIEAFIKEQSQITHEQQHVIDVYFALLELLGYPQEKFSIEEMSADIDRLFNLFVKREERRYIRKNIYEVFEMHGYLLDRAAWAEETPCDIRVANLRNAKCRITSTGDEFLFESQGVIGHAGSVSADERKCVLRDEKSICEMNIKIEEELKKRGVFLSKLYSVEPTESNIVYEEIAASYSGRISESKLGEETK